MSKRYVNSAFYVMYIETNHEDQCTVIEDNECNLIAVIPFGPEHDKKLEEFKKNYRGPKDTDE